MFRGALPGVFPRLFAIVLPREMASWGTAPALVIDGKVDGKIPSPEVRGLPDMPGSFASVDVMAEDAAPSFLLVDVDVVKVLGPVPEIRGGVRRLHQDKRFIMALETEGVFVHGKGGIVGRGEGFTEHPVVARAMRIVAGRAVSIEQDRAMQFRIVREMFFHVQDETARGGRPFLIVAGETDIHGHPLELFVIVRGVGVKAVHAALFYADRAVLYLGFPDMVLHVRMALKTEVGDGLEQMVFVFRGVRTVAAGTPHHFNGSVDMLLFRDRLFLL